MSGIHWHILGAGAIGSLFATALARANSPCTLISRLAGERERELHLLSDSARVCTPLPCSQVTDTHPIEQLLVTTKAYAMEEALQSVAHRLRPESKVLLLINGMGLAEIASDICPLANIYCGTTTEGVYRTGTHQFRHAGSGVTLLGSLAGKPQPACLSNWEHLDLKCRWEPQIESALWHKLAINCAINPLTALHQCTNGVLVQDPGLSREMERLCDEIVAVSAALGFNRTAQELHRAAREVALATGQNRSSMLQDVSAGRETEIDFITGYMVRRATEQGIDVPHNRVLMETLQHG